MKFTMFSTAILAGASLFAQTAPTTPTAPAAPTEVKKHRKKAKEATPDAAAKAATPAAAPAAADTAKKAAKAAPAAKATPAEIADAKAKGMVWVNTNTGAYHKDGEFFGATKEGKFMTAADADKAGYHLAGAKHAEKAVKHAAAKPAPSK